jgi:hypothetical protein
VVCPLILEEYTGGREFSYGNIPSPVPAFADDLSVAERHEYAKIVFEHLEKLIEETKVRRICMRFVPISKSFINCGYLPYNYLSRFGFLDVSISSQIIFLEEEDLWNNLTKGHKYEIRRGKRNYGLNIFDKDNITDLKFEDYHNMHEKAAGRVTRPQSTFDMMLDFIRKGQAVLAEVEFGGKSVSFAYVFLYKDGAYYGSACVDGEIEETPSGHCLQWFIIESLKKRGYKFYEIGWQVFSPGLNDFSLAKDISISKFKRGFGGKTVPLFMGEKYYDSDFMEKTFENRIERISEQINHDDKL